MGAHILRLQTAGNPDAVPLPTAGHHPGGSGRPLVASVMQVGRSRAGSTC